MVAVFLGVDGFGEYFVEFMLMGGGKGKGERERGKGKGGRGGAGVYLNPGFQALPAESAGGLCLCSRQELGGGGWY